jgi:lysophospholipase L1-like esterase
MPIRIVHYGDSQIEEDRITNILREEWQKQYGGGGVGLIPLHQTIPTRSIRQWIYINGTIQTAQGGPKRYIVYGPRSMRLTDDAYGVMGQVAVMDSTLVAGSQDIKLHIEPAGKKRLPYHYFSRVRLLTDSVNLTLLSPSINDSLALMDSIYTVQLPDSTTQCDMRLQGKGRVYGISLENPTGLIVDNIPMRGCSGNIFTKMDSMQLATFFSQTNTRLIIMQFGGNMIPQTENPTTISGYVRSTMRQQVRYLRACAPQAAILFIGPSDMSTNIDGQMTTYPLVPYMDKQLRKMAEEEQIAYWSMYEAMGGYNSMKAWHDRGLAGSDYVHFTRTGANKVGKMLYEWLMEYPNSLNTNQ